MRDGIGMSQGLGSKTGVLNLNMIRKRNLPYLWIWVFYYAWVIAFTTWWTTPSDTGAAFCAEYRMSIHFANMLSSVVCAFALKKERFALTARIGAAAVAVSFVFFILAPTPGWKTVAAMLMGAALGLVNISILFPFVFVMNNTEKLAGVVLGHALSNIVPILCNAMRAEGETVLAALILAAGLLSVIFFRQDQLSDETDDRLPAQKNLRPAMMLTMMAGVLGAILLLGVGKALIRSYCYTWPSAVTTLNWYLVGGVVGSLLYAGIFALPRGGMHLALSLPFGCLAVGLMCSALTTQEPYGPAAFIVIIGAAVLGAGAVIGMSTVYFVIGVVGKKYNSMPYVRRSIVIMGVSGGVCSVLIGSWVYAARFSAQIFLACTLISLVATVLMLVFSPAIARICFDGAWAGDAALPEVIGLEEVARRVEQADKLEGLGLAPREKEVCALLLRGLSIRQISGELGLAFATVNGYYRSLYKKLGVSYKAELFMRFGAESKDGSAPGEDLHSAELTNGNSAL